MSSATSEQVVIDGTRFAVHHLPAREITEGDFIITGRTATRVRQTYPFTNGYEDQLVKVVTWDGTYGTAYWPHQTFKVARPA